MKFSCLFVCLMLAYSVSFHTVLSHPSRFNFPKIPSPLSPLNITLLPPHPLPIPQSTPPRHILFSHPLVTLSNSPHPDFSISTFQRCLNFQFPSFNNNRYNFVPPQYLWFIGFISELVEILFSFSCFSIFFFCFPLFSLMNLVPTIENSGAVLSLDYNNSYF